MNQLTEENLSSIQSESMAYSNEESQVNIISIEISNLSCLSLYKEPDRFITTEYSKDDSNRPLSQIKERENILQNEYKLYDKLNRKENIYQKEIGLSEELANQLQDIKSKIEDLKNRLKGSQSLIDAKAKENSILKE